MINEILFIMEWSWFSEHCG